MTIGSEEEEKLISGNLTTQRNKIAKHDVIDINNIHTAFFTARTSSTVQRISPVLYSKTSANVDQHVHVYTCRWARLREKSRSCKGLLESKNKIVAMQAFFRNN